MTLLFYLSFFRFASGIRDFFCRLTRLIVLLRKAVGRWYSERVRLDHRIRFEGLGRRWRRPASGYYGHSSVALFSRSDMSQSQDGEHRGGSKANHPGCVRLEQRGPAEVASQHGHASVASLGGNQKFGNVLLPSLSTKPGSQTVPGMFAGIKAYQGDALFHDVGNRAGVEDQPLARTVQS